ncbi:MAG TPA: serine hydrolase domain-containing protein [Thermoanaerobaculia bacterium]|nr:serine hydrolase domain-containing protein [Thermoanaerobaculia bacterium]
MRVLLLFVSLLSPLVTYAQTYDDQLRAFDSFAQLQMKTAQMPALSVAVMKDDFVWSKGYGFADLENKVAATAESSYRLASVTKPMTAVAIMKLVEEGKIDLDAEIQTYVPSFPRKPWPITIRQLLGHLGGISHYRDNAAEQHFRDPKSTREALAVFQDFDLVAEPGTRWSYTSYGYVLLGAAIEGASGKRYADAMRELVWAPLGMTATRMDDPRAMIPNRVRGYELRDGRLRNSEFVDVSSRFAAGGTRSTVDDLLRFVRGLDKVLKPATIDLMWTSLQTKDGTPTQWGLGWDVSPIAGRFRVAHDGSQQETRTLLVYFPRARFAIALATNLEDANLDVFANKLGNLFLGDDWDVRPYVRGDAKQAAALIGAFNRGLAYYDRYGKAVTSDPKELAKAFQAFDRVKVGSWIAQSLGDVDRYHRLGAFAFFNDYAASGKKPRLDPALAKQLATWTADWKRTSQLTVDQLDGVDASVIPNFSADLVERATQKAMRGDIAGALPLAKLAATQYPDFDAPNGLYGVLLVVTGDAANGEALLRKSSSQNPNGFFSPTSAIRISGVLAGLSKPAAIRVLEIAKSIYPENQPIAKQLAALRP